MILETERLILRPWQETDAAILYKWASDPEIGPACGWQPHESEEVSAWTIANVLNGPHCFAAVLKETGEPVGSIELMEKSRYSGAEGEYELGYWMARPCWGRGLIPEAAEELLRYGFEELGIQAVWCANFLENRKSARVQEKLGFVYVKTLEDVEIPLIHAVKTMECRIIKREEWLKKHSR